MMDGVENNDGPSRSEPEEVVISEDESSPPPAASSEDVVVSEIETSPPAASIVEPVISEVSEGDAVQSQVEQVVDALSSDDEQYQDASGAGGQGGVGLNDVMLQEASAAEALDEDDFQESDLTDDSVAVPEDSKAWAASSGIVYGHAPWDGNEESLVCGVSSPEPTMEKERVSQMQARLLEVRGENRNEAWTGSDMEDCFNDQLRMLRFLRGYGHIVDESVDQYVAHLKWRAEKNLASIKHRLVSENLGPDDFPHSSKVMKRLPMVIAHKTDRFGDVMSIERSGYIDVQGLVSAVTLEEFEQFFVYMLEWRLLQLERASLEQHRMARLVIVKDLQGFSREVVSITGLKYIQALIKTAQAQYPESVSSAYIINTPWVFNTVWRIIKRGLRKEMLFKISFSGPSDANPLLERVPRDNLPVGLGGSCACEGGCLPETGLLLRSYEESIRNGAIEVELGRRGANSTTFLVMAGRTIHWSWDIQSSDVEFSVSRRVQGDGGASEEVLLPMKKYNYGAAIEGSWTAEKDTTVVLTWKNPARLSKRKFVYKVDVLSSSSQ